jgi:hypothetical protein
LDRDTYGAVAGYVNLGQDHPLGLMHSATEVDGTTQVAQIWDSEDYARLFDEDRLGAALQAVGAGVDANDIATFELRHLVTP